MDYDYHSHRQGLPHDSEQWNPVPGPPPLDYSCPPPAQPWYDNGHPQQSFHPSAEGGSNVYYAAATDVLGMGPPPPPPGSVDPGVHPNQPFPPPGPFQQPYPDSAQYPDQYSPPAPTEYQYPNQYSPPGPSPSPYAPQNYGQPQLASQPYLPSGSYGQPPGGYPQSSQSSLPHTSSVASSRQSTLSAESEIETRPEMRRNDTSMNLRTRKTKAIDLSAPPFTKEYIDQYRQRIKDDPDPEAHFQYAKYLIEAAKKVGEDAKDQRGLRKYRDALIAESLKVIRRLATQGEPYDEAQFFLAGCYGTGQLNLPVDHERAYHLYLQAARQNHPAAIYRVAVCNQLGAGTRIMYERAVGFYRKAATLGDTAAMYKLATILLKGDLGQTKNPREAIRWLQLAADQADEENPHALHELAYLHETEKGERVVPVDKGYARVLYKRAADLGYNPSQLRLGQAFEYGQLTCPVDPRRSIAWYTKAASNGHSDAELALSGWYLTGSEGVLKQSDNEAYLWARRAANKGLSKAEYAVGYYTEVGIGVKADLEVAKRWYMRAAAQNNERAMKRLTELKREGANKRNMARPSRKDMSGRDDSECVIA